MTTILLNGQPHECAHNSNFLNLINELNIANKRIAIECNGEIIPRSQYSQRLLCAGDQIEIVVAVGGG